MGGRENRLGRHYSRFSPFLPAPALASQSLALRKLCDAGSNRRRRVSGGHRRWWVHGRLPSPTKPPPYPPPACGGGNERGVSASSPAMRERSFKLTLSSPSPALRER